MKRILTVMCTCCLLAACVAGPKSESLYLTNRAPLVEKPLTELPLGAVKADGWLLDQLQRQVDGLTGHLDTIYPQVMGPRNGWLGGDGDMWERGPYWIDGLLPLAYMLDDQTLKDKVQPWVEWALQSQQEDGFFGPAVDLDYEFGLQRNNAKDWWPRMVVLKVLKQYYDATGDERVISFMTSYFKYQLATLPEQPLHNWTWWAVERGGDNLYIVYWLYNITGDKFLLELGDLLASQTADWKGRFSDKTTLTSLYTLHCVDMAQGFKQPVIRYQATKDQAYLDAVDTARFDLRRGIGWPTGLYGADEMLHSGNPTQGSELCAAVEMMFSLEKMVEITGRTDWADWLERVTFNALPTQATDAYDARQYYQQCNQIEISWKPGRNFMTCYNGTDQLYGVLCGYPCCTSNMHQGWPKFTKHLWYASADRGLAAMVYSPCNVTAKVADGQTVKITEATDYPFDETITLTVNLLDSEAVSFPLHLRIPGWCDAASIEVNGEAVQAGEAGDVAVISRQWQDGDTVVMTFPMKVSVGRWYEYSATLEHGPLVYALKIGEKWAKKSFAGAYNGRHGEWYYEVLPTTPWNYALIQKDVDCENLDSVFVFSRKPLEGYPWNLENAPVELKAKAKRMPVWTEYNGSAGPLPYSEQYQGEFGDAEEITLIPYGCTTLRITEFPVTSR